MYDLENKTQQKDKQIIPSPTHWASRSLSNFHDVEDEDDLSTGKEKSTRTSVRKMVMALEDNNEQRRRFKQSRRHSPKTLLLIPAGYFKRKQKNPQAHGNRCSFHRGVFQSIDFPQGT